MRNKRTANELLQDYAAKEWEQRQQWERVLGDKRRGAKVLAKSAIKREVKPVQKVGFFSRFFKVI